jgi:hypothetical protein
MFSLFIDTAEKKVVFLGKFSRARIFFVGETEANGYILISTVALSTDIQLA